MTDRGAQNISGVLRRNRRFVSDVAAMVTVPIALIAVFLFPTSVLRSLAFQTTDPSLVTAYTTNFVHFRVEHLLGNLLGYCVIVGVTYGLSAASQQRRQFRAVFALLLTGFPFVLSFGNWLVLGPGLAIGFSGILLGFYGYLPLALYQYVTTHARGQASIQYAPLAFFFGSASIAVVLIQTAVFSILIALVTLLLAIGYLGIAAKRTSIRGIGRLKRQGFSELALGAGSLYLLYPFASFSTTSGADGAAVNVFVHLLGYALSFMIIYITIMVDRSSSWEFPVEIPLQSEYLS